MKEMFYLTTHSTHFIYGYMASMNTYEHMNQVLRKQIEHITASYAAE